MYQFFFNSLPPSPSYLILFSLLPFLSILFDSYPFSTQLLYIPTSLSFGSYSYFHSLSVAIRCLTSFSAFACSLYPICFLSLFSIASLWCHHAVTPIIFSVAISLSFSHLQQPNSIYSHFQLHLIDAIHIYPCICLSDNDQTEKFLPQFTQSFSCRTLSSCTSNLH